MTGPRITSWWRGRTLRRRLVIGVSTVVTIVVLAVGIVSILSLRTYFNVMNDAEVDESLDALFIRTPGTTTANRAIEATSNMVAGFTGQTRETSSRCSTAAK